MAKAVGRRETYDFLPSVEKVDSKFSRLSVEQKVTQRDWLTGQKDSGQRRKYFMPSIRNSQPQDVVMATGTVAVKGDDGTLNIYSCDT